MAALLIIRFRVAAMLTGSETGVATRQLLVERADQIAAMVTVPELREATGSGLVFAFAFRRRNGDRSKRAGNAETAEAGHPEAAMVTGCYSRPGMTP
jgi:hypothetical protein